MKIDLPNAELTPSSGGSYSSPEAFGRGELDCLDPRRAVLWQEGPTWSSNARSSDESIVLRHPYRWRACDRVVWFRRAICVDLAQGTVGNVDLGNIPPWGY